MIPGLSQLKTWGLMALGVLSVVFWALLNRSKAAHATARLKGINAARKVEQDAHEAMAEGLQGEADAINKVINTDSSKRNDFE